MKYFSLFILALLLLIFDTKAFPNSNRWTPIPLTSAKQKQEGLTGGEGMQMVFGIAYAPSNPNVVYIVSDTSQAWKSADGGNTWQMKNKGFVANGGISIAVDPLNENIVFAAGSHAEEHENISLADGIYQTFDGGENWKLVKQTPYFRGKEGIHFAFDKGSSIGNQTKVIYAGTHMDGLLKSSDGGATWKYLGLKGIRIFDVKLNPKTPSRLIAMTQDGFYVIEDHGNRIEKLYSKGLPRTDLPITNIGLDKSNPNVIYAAPKKAGIYRSDDGGKTFNQINKELAKDIDYNQVSVCSSDSRYIYVSLDRHGSLNPLWSNDGGKTLNKPFTLDAKERSLIKGRFFSAPIAIHPENCQVALTSANGADRIIKTTDGGRTWNYSNSGYMGGRMGIGKSSLAFSKDSKKMIFFLIDFGPALTVDGGETFQMLDIPRLGAKTTPVGAASHSSEVIVTAIGEWRKQTLVFSNDGGKKWKAIPDTEDNYRLIAFHPQKPNIIYAQGFISKDNGIIWKKLSEKIYAVFRGNGDIVYSLSEIGKNKSIIKRSNDQGETWNTPYPELSIEMKTINEIEVDTMSPDRIYIASNAGFYIFDGKGWIMKAEESGLSKDYFGLASFKCVAVDPMHPEIIYTGRWAPGKGHSNGIFRSTDYGKRWEKISYNLGDITIWSVSVSPHDGTVYIGSSHGTWKLPPPY